MTGIPRPHLSGRRDRLGRPIRVTGGDSDGSRRADAPPPPAAVCPSIDDEGWEFHRNGIGGRPFLVAATGDGGVRISFMEPGGTERFAPPVTVPAAMIAHAANQPVTVKVDGLGYRMVSGDRFGFCVFDTPGGVTMVAVTDLDADDNDYATAVLAVTDIAAGDIRVRWRGDDFHRACLRQIRSRTG